ncbi:MAG: protein kinase domain-containing protein [Planctomycetota bacterium]|jgi:serine/threonine protein kinase/formylglycine-generating enzyme required for sulfatase activity
MAERNPFIGKEIEGWKVTEELGRGGMGVVVLAENAEGEKSAIKLLPKDVAKDAKYIARFEREASVLETVDHTNILQVYGTGRTPGGVYYIIMEYVDGKSLGDVIKMIGRLRPDHAMSITCKVAEGLQAGHDKSIIHRDIKPDNILLDRSGAVKISDFGLAKDTSENVKLTVTGQVVGTPAYMSPEQGMGKKVDFRTDVYSLGVTLYTMLTGQRPFIGKSPIGVVMMHIHEPPPEIRKSAPGLPEGLYDLVARMMEKDREERIPSAEALVEALHEVAEESQWDISMPPTLADDDIDVTLDDVHGIRGVVDQAIHEDRTLPTVQASRALEETVAEGLEEGELPGSVSDPMVGKMIGGKYLVRSLLGEGGMGSVYLVRHKDLNVDYALKVLRPDLVANEGFRERFLREAKAATSFVHKHAIQIRDFGLDDEYLYMTMDYSRGLSLHEILEEKGALSEKEAVEIAHQILLALKEAHSAGLIHRDLKPANIMIEERGGKSFVRILDFGVAKMVADEESGDVLSLTRTGTVVGTLQYMSPEQAAGSRIDPRSDLYSVGAILYESLSGERPIEAENAQQMIYKLTVERPTPLSEHVKGVSKPLERLIMNNLDKEPVKRSASAAVFLAELADCVDFLQSEVLVRREKTGWLLPAIVAGGLVLSGVVTVLLLWQPWAARPAHRPDGGPGTSGPGSTSPEGKSSVADREARQKEYKKWRDAGREALDAGDHAKAIDAFRKARAADPSEEIEELLKTARYGQAMALARKAFQEKDYAVSRDHAYTAQKNALTAEEEERAKEILDRSKVAVNRAKDVYKQASAHDKAGEVLKAFPLFEEYAENYPKGPKIEEARAWLEANRKALEDFEGLIIRSNPSGAKVMLDGLEIGVTPLLHGDVSPGSHTLILELTEHNLRKEEVVYEAGKLELDIDLTSSAFGTLRVLGAGDVPLTVSFRGADFGTLPTNISKVPPGKGKIRVTGPDMIAYDLPFEATPGQTATVTVDFKALVEAEEKAFTGVQKGESLVACLTLFRDFLEAFPAGKHGETVGGWFARVQEEAKLFTEARNGDRRAAAEYLRKFENKGYPSGWHVDEVKDLLKDFAVEDDDRAFRDIASKSTLPGRKEACREYLDSFLEGAHRQEVKTLYEALKDEEIRIVQFDAETDFGEKVRFGRDYLKRFRKGFETGRIAKEVEALEAKERAAYEGVISVRDPEEVLRQGDYYSERFSGGRNEEEVLKEVQLARQELKALEACSTEAGCRSYLQRFPKGFYREAVEARLTRFGWQPQEAAGVGQPRLLPKDIRKGKEAGEYRSRKDPAPMVYVPGGIFPLGTNDYYAGSEERPQVYVYVGPFFIDKYEVTNRRYKRFLEWSQKAADPWTHSHPLEKDVFSDGKDRTPEYWDDPQFNKPDQPVVGVDWFDAWAYARWSGKSLPTEAQWEVAASCDPKSRMKWKYPWGNEKPTASHAVWDAYTPLDVGGRRFGASPFGAQDMAGNVAEWCFDAWDDERWEKILKDLKVQAREWIPYRSLRFALEEAEGDPGVLRFDREKSEWAVRGGSFKDDASDLLTVARHGFRGRSKTVGFRCVMVPGQ